MMFVLSLSKLLRIKEKPFIKSLKSFVGLPHRYEIFLKKGNCTFINDSKATSFQASKSALKNGKDIFWIVGGLPKKNDKFNINNVRKKYYKKLYNWQKYKFF